MLEALEVIVPNHPKARERNRFDAPVDVKEHDWVHTNVKFKGTPAWYGTVYEAFKGTTPFTDLGYVAKPDCPTHTISRWSVRECPVPEYEGTSLWVAFESRVATPSEFLQYVATTQGMNVHASHCPVYSIKWVETIYSKGKPLYTK